MLRLLFLALACLTLASGARGQTCSTSWENPVDGDWDDGTKWTNGIPIANSDACITAPGTYTVTLPSGLPVTNLQTLTVGGTSGTQTLLMDGYMRLTDATIGARGRMEILPTASSCFFCGLEATGTVLVEGFLRKNSTNGVFLTNTGDVEVASGGTLRATNGARLGGSNGTFTVRGTAELADGSDIRARMEVFGGTVRVTSGQGDLFNSGGILRNATLDAASGATLVISGNYALEGTISGAPEGEVGFATGTLTAAASGATLNMTGQGVRLGVGLQRQTVLTGGPVRNTGRVVFDTNNFFANIRGTTFTNEGALDLEGDMLMTEGAVVRNRPSGVIRMIGTQIYQSPNTGVVRVENAGLIQYDDPPGNAFGRFNGVTLESLSDSEIRVFGSFLDLATGPNTETLPPGMRLTGDGQVRFNGLPIRSTYSPGTDADPIGSLGPTPLDQFILAPEALTILDIGADGVSDRISNDTGNGASMTLGGTLRLRLRPGFRPAIGDAWTIAINGPNPVLGAFARIEAAGAPSGVSFVVDTSFPGTAVLRAVAQVSVGTYAQHVLEGQAGTFVLSHPSSPEAYTINVETGGTATLFTDYTLGASRGVVRVRPNSVNTLVQAFMRSDSDDMEGEETITLRVVPGLEAVPGNQPEGILRIQDGPRSIDLSVNGINPAFGANFGLVTAIIYGTAFTDDLDIRLEGPATIEGTAIAAFPQAGGVRVTFDLRDQPPGLYDVVVTGNGVATLVDGFGVVAPGVEFPIWAAVNGTAAPRFGRYSTYTVTIGNDGLVDVYDTLVNLRLTGVREYTLQQTSELVGYEDAPEGVEIEGQDIVPLYLYKIPAGGNVQFSVRALPATNGQPLGVAYQLHPPNAKASFTASGDFDDIAEDGGNGQVTYWGLMAAYLERFLAAGAPLTPEAAGTVGGDGDLICLPRPSDPDALDLEELLSGTDPKTTEAASETGARIFSEGSDILILPDGPSGVNALELIHAASAAAQEINQQASQEEIAVATLRAIHNMVHDSRGTLVVNIREERAGASALTPSGGVFGISSACAGGIVGASYDPNDKLGPFGVGDGRFMRSTGADVPYTVRFENEPTAAFPAQEVIVVDSLDTAVFDLSTFGLGPITWGETGRLTPPTGATSFEAEVDLSPEARLLVTAGLDVASGRVEWHFVTIDPATGDLPEDGTIGFLPPNVMSPEGEGAVQFTVKTLNDLPTGTAVSNSAEIVFDVNEPILTPVWTNTLDDTAPVSGVQPLAGTETNPITLTLNGSDAGSGVQAHIVYASKDGGAFRAVGISDDGTFSFEGDEGSTYGFYSIAYDRVDNLEGLKTEAEATTMIVVAGEGAPTGPLALTLEAPRPNPARGLVRLRFGLPGAGEASVRVLDALGREVAVLASGETASGWHVAEWQPDVASGVYVVELRSGDAVQVRRLTVIR